jgi:archaemetzincin
MKRITFWIIILLCTACVKQNENEYFNQIEKNDIKLAKPVEGEWLYSHKEKGQSYEQFTNSKNIVPTSESNIIYIRPIAKFNSLQNKQIELLREYLEIYFQLKTKTLETVSNDVIPESAQRIGYENNQQFLAGYILDNVLKKDKPLNRIALMGLTEVDLYPKPEWNFVFGLASYRDRVGVSSIYRLQDGKLTADNFNLCLSRLLKISSHEIGHMFGLRHCIDADCVMNGTNSMSETDKNSIRLCSVCQKKLNSGIKYDNKKRLKELEAYFKRNNLTEGLKLSRKDAAAIQ